MSDRVFIITGAARGIGYACAQRLVNDGHRVVLADRDTETGAVSGKDLADGTDRAIFVECDVSDPLSVHNLIAETLGAYDRIDGLVNMQSSICLLSMIQSQYRITSLIRCPKAACIR